MNHHNGLSSMLFLISATNSFYNSTSMLWKFANILLPISSYLCNSSGYNKDYLLLDYYTIYLISISYIYKLAPIRISLEVLLCIEWYNYNSIECSKNVAFLFAIVSSIINTYTKYYYNNTNKNGTIMFYILLSSAILATITYIIRYQYFSNNHNIILTTIFHICITTILYISSFTV